MISRPSATLLACAFAFAASSVGTSALGAHLHPRLHWRLYAHPRLNWRLHSRLHLRPRPSLLWRLYLRPRPLLLAPAPPPCMWQESDP